MTVFVANTNLLMLSGLHSHIEDEFVNDGTVTVTVTDPGGTTQTGAGWPTFPLTMEYVAESDGDYRAILADSIPFVARKLYMAKIDADAGTDRKGQWHFKFTPAIRR